MSKQGKSSGGSRNADRANGKAWKKVKRTGLEGSTGRTVGGYSAAKVLARAERRAGK